MFKFTIKFLFMLKLKSNPNLYSALSHSSHCTSVSFCCPLPWVTTGFTAVHAVLCYIPHFILLFTTNFTALLSFHLQQCMKHYWLPIVHSCSQYIPSLTRFHLYLTDAISFKIMYKLGPSTPTEGLGAGWGKWFKLDGHWFWISLGLRVHYHEPMF